MRVQKRVRPTAARSLRGRAGGASLSAHRPARWLATAAVLLVQLFGVGHFALFAHVRCSHGELTHGGHAQAAHAAVAPGADASRDASGPDEAGQGDAPDGHEHCEGSGLVPAPVVVALPPAPVTLLEVYALPDAGALPRGVRVVALLALAPKSSPPA